MALDDYEPLSKRRNGCFFFFFQEAVDEGTEKNTNLGLLKSAIENYCNPM